MKYLLNSAVITGPGLWRYDLVSLEAAVQWLLPCDWTSGIRYPDTAEALSLLSGIDIPLCDRPTPLAAGDEALVFRLNSPRGGLRIPTNLKGKLGWEFVRNYCEIGLLRRLE